MIEVYVDGSSRGNPGPAGIGVCIPSDKIEYSEYIGDRTNNEAEAMAILKALQILNKSKSYIIYTDSAVIHGHLVKGWKVNATNLQVIYVEIGKFEVNYKLELIRSEDNLADRLAKLASDTKQSSGRFEVTSDASKTDDSKKLIKEPTTDASKDYAAPLEHETPMAYKEPVYRLSHDIIYRELRVYQLPTGMDGKPLEGGTPEVVAHISEELAIELVMAEAELRAKKGIVNG